MQLSFTEKKNIRKIFGKLKESLSIPNLIEVQKNSYKELTDHTPSLENKLTKGFMWKNNEMLVWCLKKDLKKIKGKEFKGSFVLHATDRLSQYLSENIKQKYGLGTCHSVFNGSKCTGVFKVRRSGKEMTVTHFIGERHERYVIEAWARQLHFGLEWNLKHEETVEIS